MSEKLCVFCDHLSLNVDAEYGYYEGDVYPRGTIHCQLSHWSISEGQWSEVKFAKGELADAIQTAKKCPDYSPPNDTFKTLDSEHSFALIP